MKKIILITLLLVTSNCFAAEKLLVKSGKMIRVDAGDYVHCIFTENASKEEMDLWPAPKLKPGCDKFVGKKVTITLRPEKVNVPEAGGMMDILRLIKIEPELKK